MGIIVNNFDEQKIRKSILFGFILGVFPLFSLQAILGFILFLFFNIAILPAALTFFIFKGTFYFFEMPLHHLGSWILELTFLQNFFTLLYNIPLIPMTRFHESLTMGSMVVGIFLFPFIYFMTRFLSRKYTWTSFSKIYARFLCVIGFGLYLVFSFNSKLKEAIENRLSQSYGQQVSIEDVDTLISKNEIIIKKVEFPLNHFPSKNFFEISNISLKLSPAGFIWGRIIIEEAILNSIQLHTQRTSKKELNITSPINNSELSGLKALLRRDLNGYITGMSLDQFQSLLSTSDPLEKVSKINEILLSEKKFEEIIQKNKKNMETWRNEKKRLLEDKLLTKDKLNLKLKDLESEMNASFSFVNQLNDFLNQDLLTIRSQLAISETPLTDLSVQLFGENALDDLVSIKKFHALIQDFFSPKKNGVYQFPAWNEYPSFWLKKLKFSSISAKGTANGNMNGELTDLTTDPKIVNQPMIMMLSGNFPTNNIFGFFATLTIDHRNNPTESLSLNIKNYPMANIFIPSSKNNLLEIKNAKGSLAYLIQTSKDKFRIESTQEIKSYVSKNEIKNKFLKPITEKALMESPSIRIQTRATGSWKNNNIEVQSNLGKAMAKELFVDNKSKLHSLNQKIEELFAHKIQTSKDELEEQIQAINLLKKEIQHLVKE
jgi:uncharacterized protein (TIGR03546 family)